MLRLSFCSDHILTLSIAVIAVSAGIRVRIVCDCGMLVYDNLSHANGLYSILDDSQWARPGQGRSD